MGVESDPVWGKGVAKYWVAVKKSAAKAGNSDASGSKSDPKGMPPRWKLGERETPLGQIA